MTNEDAADGLYKLVRIALRQGTDRRQIYNDLMNLYYEFGMAGISDRQCAVGKVISDFNGMCVIVDKGLGYDGRRV